LFQDPEPNEKERGNGKEKESEEEATEASLSSIIDEEKKQRALTAWATALAIEFFEMYLSKEREEWDLLASKVIQSSISLLCSYSDSYLSFRYSSYRLRCHFKGKKLAFTHTRRACERKEEGREAFHSSSSTADAVRGEADTDTTSKRNEVLNCFFIFLKFVKIYKKQLNRKSHKKEKQKENYVFYIKKITAWRHCDD